MTTLRAVATAPGTRRTVILALARAWPDLLTAVEDHLTADEAHAALLRAVAANAHPAAREAVVFLMPPLLEAVGRLEALGCGQLDPADVVDRWVRFPSEVAADVLAEAVEDALAPLVTGLPR
jgi:hypothetical protein